MILKEWWCPGRTEEQKIVINSYYMDEEYDVIEGPHLVGNEIYMTVEIGGDYENLMIEPDGSVYAK